MSKPRVWFERAILPGFEEEVAQRAVVLGPASLTPEDPLSALVDAEGAVASTYEFDNRVFARAPDLRVVARTGIGVDKVDLAAATDRGIVICNTPDGPTQSTAEHAIMLMLMAAKRVKGAEAALRSGGEDFFAAHTGTELATKTLGLVGYGRIARSVAHIAKAIGMRVVAFDPNLPAQAFDSVERADALDSLLASSDVVSLHVPLTDSTEGMFGDTELKSMKPGGILVNTARGGLLDLEALREALDVGHLTAAALDVTEPEPLPPEHPLLHRLDVVVTPHVASATRDAKARIFRTAVDQVLDVLEGRAPKHPVNPEVLQYSTETQMERN